MGASSRGTSSLRHRNMASLKGVSSVVRIWSDLKAVSEVELIGLGMRGSNTVLIAEQLRMRSCF
jgi:hypothetical protein